MLSAKVVLLSAGVLSMAVALRLAVPAVAAFVRSEVPRIYGTALAWLTPPYLYFVINVIIISIAASSRFQKAPAEEEGTAAAAAAAAAARLPAEIQRVEEQDPRTREPVTFAVEEGEEEEAGDRPGFRLPAEYGGLEQGAADKGRVVETEEKDVAAEAEGGVEEEFVISRSSWTPRRRETSETSPAAEKPLVSVRFAARRGIKASPEGRALGVARPKKNETLENTWKAITDGRAMPLTRHLKKSDTWAADGGRAREESAAEKTPVRKSETFKERRAAADSSPSPSPGGSRSGRLRREASLGQDELNRRVEAFIRKFNEEMRLQRQESFKHYAEMVNRDAY